MCGRICRAQTCAHSGIESSTLAKGFLQGGPKVRKNFEFCTISRLCVHIFQKRLKYRHISSVRKTFIPPLSNCRMCMDPSLTRFYRVGQKLSDLIPVLRITPRATEPSTVCFFSASSCAVAYVGHIPAHILALNHPGWPRGFHRVGQKVRKKFEFLTISTIYVPVSLQPL